MEVTVTIPRFLVLPARYWKWWLTAAAIAAVVAFSPFSSPGTRANPPQPCTDLDGDGVVTANDVDIVTSYYLQTVPPAPVQADVVPNGVIDLANDILTVTADANIGLITNCQTKPITFKGETRINVQSYGRYVLPKSCYDVFDATQTPLFLVCDNDFQGPPAIDPACLPAGVCSDADPEEGRIDLQVVPGTYHVVVAKVPANHTSDVKKLSCTNATNLKCVVVFNNVSEARPWYQWDVHGPDQSWPPDGIVDLPNDILAVIEHYCPNVMLPCAKPPP